jgi:RND family efflux transporter MFP subunit
MARMKINELSQGVLVAGILVLATVGAVLLFVFKPVAERKPAPYEPPQVQVIEVRPQALRIPVHSQGTVKALAEIDLSVEVPGRISRISAHLNDGEYFKKGEVLAHIDDKDYKLAITKAEAQVAAARQALARVEAEAEQARFDIQRMGNDLTKTSAYALREPHLKEARANLKAAQADLAIARLNFDRTQVHAPFDGRVIQKQVDVGEYVSPGISLAQVYSTAKMEVKLPLSQRQIRLIDVPGNNGEQQQTKPPQVTLEADYAGRQLHWQARLTRTESVIDTRNRLLNGIAEIDTSTFSSQQQNGSAPTAGLFVRAIIEGRLIDRLYVIPRGALRSGNQVWLFRDKKLHIARVEVLHKDDKNAYIEKGLDDGDRVVTSALDYAIQGMQLSLME